MSDINVTVTNAGAANVSVSNGSTVNATVGNGGAVNVSTGTISPGNATVVSGTLTINSTTTLAAGQAAYVKNDAGTAFAAKLDIGIPAGPATLVSVGNTTTLSAGSNATVNGTSSGGNLTLAFSIPRGVDGTNGTNGITPAFAIGNVVTGAAGSSASVTATTSNSGANVTLDLTIPRGDPGTNGTNGTGGSNLTLSDATPSNLGTASAGSSNLAARADHVHTLPTLSTLGAAAAAHNHPYVTSLNNLTGGLTLAAGGNVTITSANSTLTIAASGGGLGANDAVDGGDYVGEIPSIIFSLNPQNQTVNLPIGVTFGNATTISTNISEHAGSFAALNGVLFARSDTNPYVGVGQSTDDGATWTRRTDMSGGTTAYYGELSIASNSTRTVLSAGVGSGSSGSGWFYSDDGLATVTHVSNSSLIGPPRNPGAGRSNARSVVWFGGRFIAVRPTDTNFDTNQDVTGAILSSTDGVQWSQSLAFDQSSVSGVFIVGSTVRVVGSSLTASSSDGVSWSTAAGSGVPLTIVTDGIRLVGVSGGVVKTSTNGTSWQTSNVPITVNLLHYARGLFWAWDTFSSGQQSQIVRSNQIASSPDGIAWALNTHNQNMQLFGAVAASNSSVLWLGLTNSGSGSLRATVASTFGSATLTVAATLVGGNPISYQWQRSTDAGSSWLNVAAATATNISVTNITAGDNGTRYRALASATGATSVASQSATLTVTG
jgi:hypothetical protein